MYVKSFFTPSQTLPSDGTVDIAMSSDVFNSRSGISRVMNDASLNNSSIIDTSIIDTSINKDKTFTHILTSNNECTCRCACRKRDVRTYMCLAPRYNKRTYVKSGDVLMTVRTSFCKHFASCSLGGTTCRPENVVVEYRRRKDDTSRRTKEFFQRKANLRCAEY